MNSDRITSKLEHWYAQNKRDLPWRGLKDPYPIWLSEVILQQTRVQQGLPYYSRFVSAFPDVHALAAASQTEVLKLWEGLGYYSRGRNLHKAAQMVSSEFDGRFPDSAAGLLKLPGVGPYTAAAIASICYDERIAVVDGNVNRFISRLYGIKEAVDSSLGKAMIHEHASSLMETASSPAEFNQSLMEMGATICSPKSPSCEECPVSESCIARATDSISDYPQKKAKKKVRKRYLDYQVILDENHTYIRERSEEDIWNGLFEFKLVEHSKKSNAEPPKQTLFYRKYRHILSHQEIHARFMVLAISDEDDLSGLTRVPIAELEAFPFARLTTRFLEEWKSAEGESDGS